MDARRLTNTLGAVSALVFLVDVVYLVGGKLPHVVHSDTAGNMLIAAASLDSRSVLTTHWFYSNGDVWLLTPHLFALVPIAIGGLGTTTLVVSWFLALAAEATALGWAYRRLSSRMGVAIPATCLTLLAWSRMHVMFVYVEVAYAMFAALYTLLFTIAATLVAARATSIRSARAWAASGAALMGVVTAQNPIRALVFVLAPLGVACVWRWNGLTFRTRAATLAGAAASWGVGYAVYELGFKRALTFSTPSGHVDFVVKDAAGIAENVRLLARGLRTLTGDGVFAAPAFIALLGAMAIVVAHVFSRALTPVRFVCVAVLAQLGAAVVPMVVGNLVLNPESVRYAMPSILVLFGLATIIAVEMLSSAGRRRTAALGWIATTSAAALLSLVQVVGRYTLEAPNGQWAHREAHEELARELSARGLSHGFATYWNANVVTLLSNGRARTCPVNFGASVVPYRWGTDVRCFEPSRLPDRFFVALTPAEREPAREPIAKTFPEPIERFEVAGWFDVRVFATRESSPSWLAPPLPEGERIRFPLHIAATHPQLSAANAIAKDGRIVATGKEGTVVYGPYLRLPKGAYTLRWSGTSLGTNGEIAFDVTGSDGKVTLAQRSIRADALPRGPDAELATLEFVLADPMPAVETRVFSRGGATAELTGLVLDRR
jgi:hypothetical protein